MATKTTTSTYSVTAKDIGRPASRPKGNSSDVANMAIRAAVYHGATAYIIPTYYGPRIIWNRNTIPYGTPYSEVNVTLNGNIYDVTITTVIYVYED